MRKIHHGERKEPKNVLCPKRQQKQERQGEESDQLCFDFLSEVGTRSLADSYIGEGRIFSYKLPSQVFQLVRNVRKLFCILIQ